MGFETILHQPLAVTLIQRWLAKQTTQPLLLWGPEGTGKRALALEAARALNGPKREPLKHPDVRVIDLAYQAVIRGEPIEKQQTIKIETILDERKRLYETPMEGPWKVSMLCDAHRMTPEAANVLLKVMEEPPARTAIFLLTSQKDRILSTLISRCQSIRFRPLPEAEQQKRLAPEQRAAIQEAEALWEQLPQMTPSQILTKFENRSRVTAAVARMDVEAQLAALMTPAARDVRSRRPGAAKKVEWIQKAQQQLRQNVPANLVYDHLLIQLSKP